MNWQQAQFEFAETLSDLALARGKESAAVMRVALGLKLICDEVKNDVVTQFCMNILQDLTEDLELRQDELLPDVEKLISFYEELERGIRNGKG